MSLLYTNKHSYLVKTINEIATFDPRVMIRTLDRQMGFHTTFRNLNPPFLNLASSHPVIYSPNVDGVREKTAYGKWGLPSVIRKTRSRNIFLVMQALNTISDLVHDPEKGYEGIRIGLIDRLQDLMLHEKPFVRERICIILKTLAGLEAGRRAIIRRYKILKNLILLLEDKDVAVRHKAHLMLELLCLSPIVPTGLNCADFTVLILRLVGGSPQTEFPKDTIITHLMTLAQFLNTDSKEVALEHNAMQILMTKAGDKNEDIQKHALECIALLCHIPRGRAEGEKLGLPVFLCKIMCKTTSMQVKSKVVGAMAFISILAPCRRELTKKCVIEQVVSVMEYIHSTEGQIMAMKLLSNFLDSARGQVLVKAMKSRIKNIFTKDNEVLWHKKLLLNLLKSKSQTESVPQ